jgi:hypothetical protein
MNRQAEHVVHKLPLVASGSCWVAHGAVLGFSSLSFSRKIRENQEHPASGVAGWFAAHSMIDWRHFGAGIRPFPAAPGASPAKKEPISGRFAGQTGESCRLFVLFMLHAATKAAIASENDHSMAPSPFQLRPVKHTARD